MPVCPKENRPCPFRPMIVAGASTCAGAGGGLYRALAEIVCGLIASVTYAWVLLVEILR
jgi:trimethylamine:corrinoid methyltransferase-like protein